MSVYQVQELKLNLPNDFASLIVSVNLLDCWLGLRDKGLERTGCKQLQIAKIER
jgi:hypothetical protein